MKKFLFTLIATVAISSFSFATNDNGEINTVIIKNEKVEIVADKYMNSELILNTKFNAEYEHIEIEFEYNISMVQIFDENDELQMAIPVGSKKVILGLSLFEKGVYKLGFTLDGFSDIQISEVQIN